MGRGPPPRRPQQRPGSKHRHDGQPAAAAQDLDLERMQRRMEAFDDSEDDEDDQQPQALDTQRIRRRMEAVDDGWDDDEDAPSGSGEDPDGDEDEDAEGQHSDMDTDGGASGSGSGSESGWEEDEEEAGLQQAVAEIPLGLLLAAKQDGAGPAGPAARAAARAAAAKASGGRYKRENKHRPSEMSSKRPVPRLREVIQVPKAAGSDPRFEDLSGRYDKDVFRKRYAFLYDEALPSEREGLKKALRRAKDAGSKRELQAQLTRVEQQIQDEKTRRKRGELEKEWRGKERASVAGGKAPYFLKKSERKRLELRAKFEGLKERGKLDKYMAKRRAKNAAKDHRYIPSGRRASSPAA